MKRVRLLFAALVLLLGIGGTGFLWYTITKGQENISVTIVSEVGDRSKAAGLTATIHQNMGRQLYWDTTFLPDTEGYAASEFTFFQQQQPEPSYYGDPFLLHPIPMNVSISTSGAFTLSEMGPPYDALETYLADLGENDSKTITLPLAELYPILPMECDQIYDYNSVQTYHELGEYFSIPTPEELSITVTAHSNAYGDVTEISISADSEPYLTSDSVLGEKGAYFVISSLPQNILLDGTYEPLSVDLSHCKDGYGIYFIPSEPFNNDTIYHIENIEMVYPVAENTRAVGIEKDADGNLLLFTETGRQWTLTIIDKNTMEPLETVPLGDIGHSVSVMRVSSSHDYLAIFYSKGTMHLFKKEQGQYTDGSYFFFLEDITDYHYNSLTTASSKDGRFAVLYCDDYYASPRFFLSIFEEDKQVYTATYETSLAKDSDLQVRDYDRIHLNKKDSLSLTFS